MHMHTHMHIHTYTYKYTCIHIYTYIHVLIYIKLATLVKDDPKAPFSTVTTPRCKGGCYSIPWVAPLYLDPNLIMLSIKQGSIKYYFLSLLYDTTRDWTPVSWTNAELHIHTRIHIHTHTHTYKHIWCHWETIDAYSDHDTHFGKVVWKTSSCLWKRSPSLLLSWLLSYLYFFVSLFVYKIQRTFINKQSYFVIYLSLLFLNSLRNNTIFVSLDHKYSQRDTHTISCHSHVYKRTMNHICKFTHTWIDYFHMLWAIGQMSSVRQWSKKLGFNSRSSNTKDSKNGTWCRLA